MYEKTIVKRIKYKRVLICEKSHITKQFRKETKYM